MTRKRNCGRNALIRSVACRDICSHSVQPHSKTTIKNSRGGELTLLAGHLLIGRLLTALMWGGCINVGSRACGIVSPSGLRFSSLEIFTQSQLQPVLTRILARIWAKFFFGLPGWSFAVVLVILHLQPVRTRLPKSCQREKGLPASPLPEHPEHIVFRSPAVQSPIPGPATRLMLPAVAQIFRQFRKSGPGSAATGSIEGRGGPRAPIMTVLTPSQAVSRACAPPGLVARIGAPC